MDQFNISSKSSNSSERSVTNTYGDGYVYTGPLSAQYYEVQPKSINELTKNGGQSFGSTSSLTGTNNPSLSTSPSTEVVSNTNQHQFKVMLLGDSGVGEFRLFLFEFYY